MYEVSAFVGEPSPPRGGRFPRRGETLTAGGEPLPWRGERGSRVVKRPPSGGETLPGGGESFPPGGERLPPRGESPPAPGEPSPSRGERLGAWGWASVSRGECLPPRGRSLPCAGERLPKGGRSLPRPALFKQREGQDVRRKIFLQELECRGYSVDFRNANARKTDLQICLRLSARLPVAPTVRLRARGAVGELVTRTDGSDESSGH